MDIARDADAILVTYAKITGDMIRQLTRCRVISRFGIGVDNVDIPGGHEKGDRRDQGARLLHRRSVGPHDGAAPGRRAQDSVHQRAGARRHLEDAERRADHRLRGAVLGLVGFGRIPQLVAPKAQAFGMKVIAYDPYVPADVFASAGVESVDFPTLLKTSDYVSIHSPLVPETKNLFNADAFRQMKPTAYS